MSFGDSKAIVTNQDGLNEHLDEVVNKHLSHPFLKPISDHTQQAFDKINQQIAAFSGPVILDSCCGVGQSTRILARRYPEALVIGVDKSLNRIERNVEDEHETDNFRLIRADLNDFYRLVVQHQWPIREHFLLYPNPWPKAKHLQRRWHGSSVFPYILQIGKSLTLRSNWLIYLQEFQRAAELAGKSGNISQINDEQPLTPFEAKYQASGQLCWQLKFAQL
ncbi:tRNA (guanine(46)-N(7))-methyltransferase TrmB [Thalassotalea sp. PS06]|uniref:tRNA (guanine(46)-N(7))-methyltransferase TrmB n=1 Tax=Thalassotalea sp. PS06 TaxID=2594005 RepID=UPI001163822A|nr:methyltransferase domain-containing protein [Thalassotalea sp. PS06]QDP00122.1 SAM-dependent methyltransferase [Thalassotalea sp. PS06]